MKVAIGSKYEGPSWDRPCLRQMPREWQLEETKVSGWVLFCRYVFRLICG